MSAHSLSAAQYGPAVRSLPEIETTTLYKAPVGVKIVRAALILALLPASVYLVPRVVNLVVTPDRLKETIVHADAYNPQLQEVVSEEQGTNAELAALDRVDQALARVRATVANVDGGLATLIDEIRGQLQSVLNSSDANVARLLAALDTLEGRIKGLNQPVGSAAQAVNDARATIASITAESRSTAGQVHSARNSADRSADNVSGSEGGK